MGEQKVHTESSPVARRAQQRALLRDLAALQDMIEGGRIESDKRRIGAEQEVFLVGNDWRPASICMDMLERLPADFTTELAAYNLECNLPPLHFGGDCLTRLETSLEGFVDQADEAARDLDARVVLAGILPTLRKSDLGLENMAPRQRYRALDRSMTQAAGGSYDLNISGLDELAVTHDSVMLESCCTSFQFHLQVAPQEFARLYNLAQVVTAPLVAASANSPVLFGKRLWHETRIPLFQQAIDTRQTGYHVRGRQARVSFGRRWVDDEVLQLFREDVASFRTLLYGDRAEDPFAILGKGGVPRLDAIQTHNGTVYRWNRACYGATAGVPHLRIEARAVAAGPTVLDEVANATFFWGALLALSAEVGDVRGRLDFADARRNFNAAAEYGLDARFIWLDRERLDAADLIVNRILPAARDALVAAGIDAADAERYLGVIAQRVDARQNGSAWQLRSLAALAERCSPAQTMVALTERMTAMRASGRPVGEWSLPKNRETFDMGANTTTVEEFMTTDLVTVQPDESVSQVAALMTWQSVRHIPVEDADGQYVGLVSSLEVIEHLSNFDLHEGNTVAPGEVSVGSIMNTTTPVISPRTRAAEAIDTMRSHQADCLPVVREGELVGVVSGRDFIHLVGPELT
jgi:CBS domain-containing protein